MFSHRLIVAAGGLVALLSAPVRAHDAEEFRALLTGFREVPVISTTGDGTFRAQIKAEEGAITFTLRDRGLEGEVTQAHIPLAQEDVNGGIVLFLCSNLPDRPPATPPCPSPRDGEVTGTLTAADVLAVPAQLIAVVESCARCYGAYARARFLGLHLSCSAGSSSLNQQNTSLDVAPALRVCTEAAPVGAGKEA